MPGTKVLSLWFCLLQRYPGRQGNEYLSFTDEGGPCGEGVAHSQDSHWAPAFVSVELPAVISSCIALLTLFWVGLWISDKIIYVYVSYLSLCSILTRLILKLKLQYFYH